MSLQPASDGSMRSRVTERARYNLPSGLYSTMLHLNHTHDLELNKNLCSLKAGVRTLAGHMGHAKKHFVKVHGKGLNQELEMLKASAGLQSARKDGCRGNRGYSPTQKNDKANMYTLERQKTIGETKLPRIYPLSQMLNQKVPTSYGKHIQDTDTLQPTRQAKNFSSICEQVQTKHASKKPKYPLSPNHLPHMKPTPPTKIDHHHHYPHHSRPCNQCRARLRMLLTSLAVNKEEVEQYEQAQRRRQIQERLDKTSLNYRLVQDQAKAWMDGLTPTNHRT